MYILKDGGRSLRAAGKGGILGLAKTLNDFKVDLELKKFSAASTDKCIIDGGQASSDDATVVGTLMNDIVQTFGQNWVVEQEKQKHITIRFKADVPLLTLTPRTWRGALLSWLHEFLWELIVGMAASFPIVWETN